MTHRPKSAKYEPRGKGALAISPEAFGFFFDVPEPPKNERRDDVAIVAVRGPLMHHEDWLFDSYDAIGMRVLEALESAPRAIVLSIDSPGGLVSGCFEMAGQIREVCARAGIPLYAYVDGQATSAAYALACAAGHIAAPASAMIGSIGVLSELVDRTAAAAMFGAKVQLITSGARKADGHPMSPITDGALAATQKIVDDLARVFFDHVATARGMSPDAVSALEAAQMTAPSAMSNGLVDQVATLDQLLAAIASGTVPTKTEETSTMTTKASKAYEDAIAALRKCAEGDDDESAKAKRMLKAELAEDEAPAPADDDAGEEEAPAVDKAEATEEAKAIAQQALAVAKALEAKDAKRDATAAAAAVETERAQLLASRPDLPAELVEVLRKPTASIDVVRDVVKTHPRGVIPNPAAAATVTGTRGASQGQPGSAPGSLEAKAMDEAMGLAPPRGGIRREGTAMLFSALDAEKLPAKEKVAQK